MLIHPEALRRDYRARGWWGEVCLHHLLARHAARVPARECVVDPPNLLEVTGQAPRRITWGEMAALVDRLACGFIRAGLAKDDVVVVQMANSHMLPAIYLACARLGIIASPVVPQYREHEIAHVLHKTAARAIVVDAHIGKHDHAAMAEGLRAQAPELRTVFVHGAPPAGSAAIGLADCLAREADAALLADHDARHAVGADDVLCILWTSGSEGHAKGVPRTHNDWLLCATHLDDAAGVEAGIGDGVRLLNGRPLTTHGSFYGSIMPWIHHAGTLVNHHPFTLPLFLEQLRTEDIHFTALAPAILSMLVAKPELLEGLQHRQGGKLRCVGSGSAPLNPALVRDFEALFGVKVINFFGSTEGAALASTPGDVPDAGVRARCFPRFGVPGLAWKHPMARMIETRLVDPETGEDITTPARAGELRYRGPCVMTGYWREPALTAAAFDEQGFFKSGDLFEIAGEGGAYYAFAGRSKDIIIRGGFNISAQEIEDLVAAHPAVAQVAVVGYPDARMGEKVCACVVLREGQSLELPALAAWLREERHISVIKLPERLLVLQALPRSPNNKVLKAALRTLAAAEAS